jgi:hypothetical protein
MEIAAVARRRRHVKLQAVFYSLPPMDITDSERGAHQVVCRLACTFSPLQCPCGVIWASVCRQQRMLRELLSVSFWAAGPGEQFGLTTV